MKDNGSTQLVILAQPLACVTVFPLWHYIKIEQEVCHAGTLFFLTCVIVIMTAWDAWWENVLCMMGKCALVHIVSVPVHADTQVVSMVTGNTGTRQARYCMQLRSWPTCLVLPSGTLTTSTVRTWGQWLPWWVVVGEWVAKWGYLLAANLAV